MSELADRLAAEVEQTAFSGVIRVRGSAAIDRCAGDADRANRRPNQLSTRFATASGTKGFTALTTMALIETGELSLDTTARSILGGDLANIDDRVTVEHLLGHRSGIGDYLDEDELDDIDAHVLGSRSMHEFASPEAFLDLLAAPPQREAPGSTFRYNNSGFVVLSLLIERTVGSYVDAVRTHVFEAADMTETGFFRSDQLPADTALGYLEDGRTNIFHLPVIGAGDGGAYTLLARQTDDPVNEFQRILKSGANTRVNLEQPVPVHIIYRTAFTDAKGRMNYRDDIYDRDAPIFEALRNAGVALPALRG